MCFPAASTCHLSDFFFKKSGGKRVAVYWNKCFFVLKDGYLFWYAYADQSAVPSGFDHKCNGMLSLADCVVSHDEEKAKQSSNELNRFRCKLTASDMTLDIRFFSSEQMCLWTSALAKAREFSVEAKSKMEIELRGSLADAREKAARAAAAHFTEKAALEEQARLDRLEMEASRDATLLAVAAAKDAEAAAAQAKIQADKEAEVEAIEAAAFAERQKLLAEKAELEAAADARAAEQTRRLAEDTEIEKAAILAQAETERLRLLEEKVRLEEVANARLVALQCSADELKDKAEELILKQDKLSSEEAARVDAERRAVEAELKKRRLEKQLRAAEGSLKSMERVLREHGIGKLDLDVSVSAIKDLFETITDEHAFEANKIEYMKEAIGAGKEYRRNFDHGPRKES